MLFIHLVFQDYPINPKSLSLGELYGEFELSTNEWTDGVLSSVMRQTCIGRFSIYTSQVVPFKAGYPILKLDNMYLAVLDNICLSL